MGFQFATATQIVFGAGSLAEAAPAAKKMGTRALVVTGRARARAAHLVESLDAAGVTSELFSVSGEPTVDLVRAATGHARREGCDMVISMGGGSAIDAGKAIAALLTNRGDPLDYIEVIGHGHPIANESAPFIAIPTTAGPGCEVTRNAVLTSPDHRVKASIRSPLMLPRMAVIDPELTLDLPRPITAATGLDALTQLIEPYVSRKANPITDSLAVEGIRRAAVYLERAADNPTDIEARTGMAVASLLGGLCLANSGLGAVHGFAAPLGGMYPAPHGAVCAVLLAPVMEANLRALARREPGSPAIARYDTVARLVTGNPSAHAPAGMEWVQQICQRLEIPRLSAYGLSEAEIPDVVKKAEKASSMKGNPIALTAEELSGVLFAAL